MKTTTQTILSVSAAAWMIAAIIGFFTSSAQADAPQSEAPNKTIIYFVRHAEDADELVDPSYTVTFNTNQAGNCYETVLNPLGKMRGTALADWFESRTITKTLTHVVATHKIRTRQTVGAIAQAAGLSGDIDQAPGDGVINVPSNIEGVPSKPGECDAGWTSSKSVIQPQTNYINTLPLGSRVVLCSHSPALYPIMQAFGIDTSDPVQFPKDPADPKKVRGFNNLWAVELNPVQVGGAWSYQGRLLEHVLLDFQLGVSVINRDHGNGPSHQSSDDKE
jgi:phosphohistidine phosphatase SixA